MEKHGRRGGCRQRLKKKKKVGDVKQGSIPRSMVQKVTLLLG